jgi:hypothetical protein
MWKFGNSENNVEEYRSIEPELPPEDLSLSQ